ncbi:MAG: hypothetical protein NUV91_06280 [Candidatus Omnitrophica bacterium]|nr:hypothetical protein [Candidatus Omnitrophota bacterium]
MITTSSSIQKNPAVILRNAVNTIVSNPIILFPLSVTAFIQILCLEVIFFAPRQPLSHFFAPLIRYFNGEIYLHYPQNFALLNEWYHSYLLQYTLYIFVQTFLLAMMINILYRLNNDQKIRMKNIFQQTLSLYLNIILAALLTVIVLHSLMTLYGVVVKRALIIRSTSGIFYIMKRIVLDGSPYFQILLAGFVTTIFSFLIPIIVIERKNILSAIMQNFKNLFQSFWVVLGIILLPLFLYFPILLLRSNSHWWSGALPPEAHGIFIIISIFVLLAIDAIQYTAITSYYLLKKENS